MPTDADPSRPNTILDGLERLADALQSVANEAREFERTVSVGGADEGIEGVVRVEVRTGIGDASRPARSPPDAPGSSGDPEEESPDRPVRQPPVDVESEADRVRVVAEMPGVTAQALEWAVEARVLTLAATTERVRFERMVTLPETVEPDAAVVTVEAGLVELVLPRAAGPEASADA